MDKSIQVFAICKALLRESNVIVKTPGMMKITAFLSTVICLHAAAGGYSQTITLSVNKSSPGKVLVEIKKQTGYEFVYRPGLLQNSRAVDLDVRDIPLKQVPGIIDITGKIRVRTHTMYYEYK